MLLKSYQELEDDRNRELETEMFQKDKCAHCGIIKQHAGEGGYLPDGRWYHNWNCRTELVGAGKLFTAKISTWKRTVDFFTALGLMENTVLISVMRGNWRYLPKDAPIIKLNNLGPSIELHKETRAFEKGNETDPQKILEFQIRYSTLYVQQIGSYVNDNGTIGAEQELEYIKHLINSGKNVVLMCICKPGDFCHRVHLKEWFTLWPETMDNIVGELVL